MPQSLVLKLQGLHTSVNELQAPEGALLEAQNIDIVKDNVAEPRRGFARLAAGYSTADDRTDKTWFYQDIQMAHHGTLGSADTISYFESGAWNVVSGTYSAPTGSKLRTLQASQNLYLTTSGGVYRLDSYTATPALSGAFKGLDLEAATNGTTGFLADGYRVAYRVIWGLKDANENLILGAPSQRADITNNTGSSTDVDLTFTIPTGVTTAWFYQVYRSAQVDNSSTEVEPNDELQLVYEGNPSSAQITAKTVTVTDITPDSLRGATIYTAGSQDGLASQNERPPVAKDLAIFNNSTFYANTTNKHRFYLTLLSVGGTNGLAVDDTITIGGIAYTAKLSETIASAQFRVYLSGTFDFVDGDVSAANDTITETSHGMQDGDPVTLTTTGTLPAGLSLATTYYVVSAAADTFKLSLTKGGTAVDITAASGGGTHTVAYGGSASQNVRDTATSLVKIINRHTNSTVYGFYLSGADDLPGKMLLEERALGGAAFSVISSTATCWSPSDIPTSGTATQSTNDRFKNGLSWSKPYQPDAVPLPNQVQVGSRDAEILRVIALKEALLILKEDGVYRLTGDYPNFNVELLDSSAKIIGGETASVLNNQIFMLSDQGVVAITGDGVRIISRPIEQDLLELVAADLAQVKSDSFGVSYETERKYMLFTIADASDTYPTQAFVYNVFTSTWTKHLLNASCGVVEENRLYLGDAKSNFINRDRKSFTKLDYVDFGFATSITVIDGTTITLSSGSDNIAVGDVLHQSDSIFAIVSAVDSFTGLVTVETNPGFTVAAADLLKAIPTRIKWVPITTGNPGITKQYHTCDLLFKTDYNGAGNLVFESDISQFEESVVIEGFGIGSWGLFPWGSRPWGGSKLRRPIRQWIPRRKQLCSQLTISFRHSVGYSPWQLVGLTVFGQAGSDRISK